MPYRQEVQLKQLLSETEEHRRFDLAASLAAQLGMEYFAFTPTPANPSLHPQFKTYSNFPKAWNECYQRCNYQSIDPIVAYCHDSLLPILWDDDAFRETPELWEQARQYGLRYGWSQSAHDLHRNVSLLSVIRSHTPVDRSEYYEMAGKTMWLCNLMHTLIFDHPSSKPKLSTRETEVLKWSAAGKTAADISCILSLSQSTVNFHIRSIITKLNCSNKTGAIATAAMSGLLG
ncbi:autoinducer binding domain-containing protein [Pseudomonas putida]|uniref:autoinducer binding domain-containing protein n=1 Tax=Pseudomonas putida TaxID=303 RepID=UPI0023667660|nr:autoinducer binding domain-containing protein [Pseudomonas putida]MDD2050416.1 autoinducer binding domain-containing protein [Pseudomonas putida]